MYKIEPGVVFFYTIIYIPGSGRSRAQHGHMRSMGLHNEVRGCAENSRVQIEKGAATALTLAQGPVALGMAHTT
jgi:hypothetical protein